MIPSKFWMLYVEDEKAPAVKHTTTESAYKEAERLAEAVGKKVYVLEAVALCELKKFNWTSIDHKCQF